MTAADSAGVPWEGRAFRPTGFEDDDGEAPPALAEAVTAYAGDRNALPAVVEALSTSRLLVPVVATAGDEAAEIAAVALAAWDASARPVPVEARRAALAAVQEGADVLVLDVAGPVPVVVARPAVWALAQGRRWVPSPEDPAVVDAVRARVDPEPDVVEVRCERGRRAELCVALAVRPGLDRAGLDALTTAVSRRLAGDATVAERVESLELRVTTAPG